MVNQIKWTIVVLQCFGLGPTPKRFQSSKLLRFMYHGYTAGMLAVNFMRFAYHFTVSVQTVFVGTKKEITLTEEFTYPLAFFKIFLLMVHCRYVFWRRHCSALETLETDTTKGKATGAVATIVFIIALSYLGFIGCFMPAYRALTVGDLPFELVNIFYAWVHTGFYFAYVIFYLSTGFIVKDAFDQLLTSFVVADTGEGQEQEQQPENDINNDDKERQGMASFGDDARSLIDQYHELAGRVHSFLTGEMSTFALIMIATDVPFLIFFLYNAADLNAVSSVEGRFDTFLAVNILFTLSMPVITQACVLSGARLYSISARFRQALQRRQAAWLKSCRESTIGAQEPANQTPTSTVENSRKQSDRSMQLLNEECQLFYDRSRETPICVHVGSLFPLQNATVLTIVSVIITYFVILLQFAQVPNTPLQCCPNASVSTVFPMSNQTCNNGSSSLIVHYCAAGNYVVRQTLMNSSGEDY